MINLKLCLLSIMVFTIDMLKLSQHPSASTSASTSSTGRSMRHVEADGHRLTDFDVKVYQACYQIPIGKGTVGGDCYLYVMNDTSTVVYGSHHLSTAPIVLHSLLDGTVSYLSVDLQECRGEDRLSRCLPRCGFVAEEEPIRPHCTLPSRGGLGPVPRSVHALK